MDIVVYVLFRLELPKLENDSFPEMQSIIARPHEYRPVDFEDAFYDDQQPSKGRVLQEDSGFNEQHVNAKEAPVADLFDQSNVVVRGVLGCLSSPKSLRAFLSTSSSQIKKLIL